MKRLLLDTEAFIWWDANDARLGGHARATIQKAAEVYVSAASAWEIAIKVALGKLRSTRRPAQAVAEAGFSELPITFEHADSKPHQGTLAQGGSVTVKNKGTTFDVIQTNRS